MSFIRFHINNRLARMFNFFISSSEGVMEGKLEPNYDTVTTSGYVKKCFKLIVDLLKNKKCVVS